MVDAIKYFYLCLRRLVFLFVLFSIYGTPGLQAQPAIESIETYTAEEGLSNRIITDVLRDSRGLLWLGTRNGLDLFDGYSFTNYLTSSPAAQHINDHFIDELEELKEKRIAIRYRFNLEFFDVYDFHLGETHKVLLNEENGIRGSIKDIAFRHLGDCWALSTDAGHLYLQVLDSDFSFRPVFSSPIDSLSAEAIFHILPVDDASIWVVDSESGISHFDSSGQILQKYTSDHFDHPGKKLDYPGNVRFIHEDQQQHIWLGFEHNAGVYFHAPEAATFKLHPQIPSERSYNNVWEDEVGNMTFGIRDIPTTLSELYCLKKDGQVESLQHLVEREPLTICLYAENMEDYLFLGTYNGLYRIRYREKNIRNYLDTIPGYWGKTIKGITGDGAGRVFFAKETQWWYQLNRADNTIDTLYIIDPKTQEPIYLLNSSQLIYEDNHLWGTHFDTTHQEGILIHLNLETHVSELFTYPQEIRSIAKSRDGHIWILQGSPGELGKLARFTPETKEYQVELYLEELGLGPLSSPNFILEGQTGTLWIGTTSGLSAYQPKDHSRKTYTMKQEGQEGLSNDQIIHIYEDEEGMIFLGTLGGGINILNPETGAITVRDESHGLANNDVCGLLPDGQNNFWVSTFNGLSYWDRQNNIFRNFFIKDGLTHNEFNRFSYYHDETGDYFFGNLNGFCIFTAKDLLREEKNPPLCLTRLAIYDSRKNELVEQSNGLEGKREIVLSPYASYFELNFTLPVYDQPEKHQYSAMLEGLEKDWTYLHSSSSPYLRYNMLQAGEYTLHLRGTTSGGNPTASTLQLKIIVKQVFYKTAWFFTLGIIAVLVLLYSWYRYRLSRLIEIERLRTRIASDLHDEVGSIMTRISMGSELLREGLYSEEEQQQELENIANQSRAVTTIMRDVVWSIDARQDRVKNLLDRMQELMEELLPIADIEFEFHKTGMQPEKVLEIDVRQNLYFIFKEAINNVVKHSHAKKVEVYMKNDRDGFELKIADSGEVSQFSDNGSGQGLKNMDMRARRIEAKLEVIAEKGFSVSLRRKSLW